MKRTLHLIILLFSFVILSCKDDDNKRAKIRLSKVTVSNSLYPDEDYLCNFSYTKEGLLKEQKESSNSGINSETTHLYDGSNRLFALDHLNQKYDRNIKEAFIYDATGRLSSATITFASSSSQEETRPSQYLTFQYGDNGRVIRINSTTDPAKSGLAIILEYDDAGNVIWERKHITSPTGELYYPHSNIKVSYDDKKNPFHMLGSPLFPYRYPIGDLSSYISSFSANNPVKVETYNERGEMTIGWVYHYEYNKEGFPSEIRSGNITQQLEYTIK